MTIKDVFLWKLSYCDYCVSFFYKQEFAISNVQQELNYVRKELIEARANKSASDDKLNNVQDQIDTMQNNINSLTDEGNF